MSHAKKTLAHPAWIMIGFWSFLYAVFFLAPITQTPPPSIAGTGFIVSQILAFCIGSVLGSGGLGRGVLIKAPTVSFSRLSVHSSTRIIRIFLLIGIVGALLCIFDKILSLDLFSLSAAGALRSERAQQLLNVDSLSSTALSIVGFLTYPAGFVAMVVALVRYEAISRATRILSMLYVVVIFFHSITTGGRSTIFVAILFLGIAFYIRNCRGLKTIPRSLMIRVSFMLLLICFFGYSILVWQTRSELTEQGIEEFLAHAAENWGVAPTESLESLADALGQPGLIKTSLSSIFYFTQSVSIIERILAMDETPLLLGTYHIDLVAAAARFLDSSDFLVQGYATLLENNIYGFFTSAWGALYIDFGFLGSYTVTMVWGWLAGFSHRHARRNIYSDGFTQYVFWIYSILISFVSPPFGFSNSAVTFIWFLFYSLLRPSKKKVELIQSIQH
jgi:oligosaccharide repeat unit polymerase